MDVSVGRNIYGLIVNGATSLVSCETSTGRTVRGAKNVLTPKQRALCTRLWRRSACHSL